MENKWVRTTLRPEDTQGEEDPYKKKVVILKAMHPDSYFSSYPGCGYHLISYLEKKGAQRVTINPNLYGYKDEGRAGKNWEAILHMDGVTIQSRYWDAHPVHVVWYSLFGREEEVKKVRGVIDPFFATFDKGPFCPEGLEAKVEEKKD